MLELSRSEQREFYNRRWSAKEYATPADLERGLAILARLAETSISKPRICDLGCGNGWFTNILNSFGPATGLDLSDAAIRSARERYPTASFACIDVADWVPPAGQFDIVVSQEVLEHVEDQDAYLRTAATLLRPGGYLILTTPNGDWVAEARRREISNQPLENWIGRRELERLARRYFQSVKLRATLFTWTPTGLGHLLTSVKLGRALSAVRLFALWKSFWLSRAYGQHIVLTARK